jgi:hypothetical protein
VTGQFLHPDPEGQQNLEIITAKTHTEGNEDSPFFNHMRHPSIGIRNPALNRLKIPVENDDAAINIGDQDAIWRGHDSRDFGGCLKANSLRALIHNNIKSITDVPC